MPLRNLTKETKNLFLKIHFKRLSVMGATEWKKYDLNNIKDIKINLKENCFEVYFKNGEWFKYYPNMTWEGEKMSGGVFCESCGKIIEGSDVGYLGDCDDCKNEKNL